MITYGNDNDGMHLYLTMTSLVSNKDQSRVMLSFQSRIS